MKSKAAKILIIIGALCVALAVFFVVRNIIQDISANRKSNDILSNINGELPELHPYSGNESDRELPVLKFDGDYYIGLIQIPSQEIELPVSDIFTYDILQYSPCRDYGSPYEEDFVICAHNFNSHFGKIGDMKQGDSVRFIDIDGNVFDYTVELTEVLEAYEVDRMNKSQWDLSLYTCTWDGGSRVTIRCVRDDSDYKIKDLE